MNIESSARVQCLQTGSNEEGQRLDNFLFRALKGVPKSHIYQIVRTGQVRVNGRRVTPNRKMAEGDQVRVPPIKTATIERTSAGFRHSVTVVYEDDDVIVYDKPSGLAVHGGSGVSAGLIERARNELGKEGANLQLIHRLDRDTSGIVMVAKRRQFLRSLHTLFREGKVVKKYVAVVYGQWEERHRVLDAALEKWRVSGGQRVVGVSEDGKASLTRTRCLKQWDGVAMLEVTLLTGRTHQIRVHLSHAGLPVVGDSKYGDFVRNRKMKRLGCQRLMLHAKQIRFRHPVSEENIDFSASVPEEFNLFEGISRKDLGNGD